MGRTYPGTTDDHCRAGSVTECLNRVKNGESYAQHQLWSRCLQRLISVANRHIAKGRFVDDAEDIALAAFHDLLRGIEANRFSRLGNRDELWQILVMLTLRRAADRKRYAAARRRIPQNGGATEEIDAHGVGGAQRGASDRHAATDHGWLDHVRGGEPTPEQAILLAEEYQSRLDQLPDQRFRQIAVGKMQGYTNRELASRFGCSLRSIERKLAIIRRRWTESE